MSVRMGLSRAVILDFEGRLSSSEQLVWSRRTNKGPEEDFPNCAYTQRELKLHSKNNRFLEGKSGC